MATVEYFFDLQSTTEKVVMFLLRRKQELNVEGDLRTVYGYKRFYDKYFLTDIAGFSLTGKKDPDPHKGHNATIMKNEVVCECGDRLKGEGYKALMNPTDEEESEHAIE